MKARTKPWLLSALVVLTASLPYFANSLTDYRIASGARLQRVFLGPFEGRPAVPVAEPLITVAPLPMVIPKPSSPERPAVLAPTVEAAAEILGPAIPTGPVLEDPSDALHSFHEALARSEAGKGVVRISHFGDSPITGDLISGEARARFQQLYGDAGHGWILPGRPWEWYGHLGVNLDDSGWSIHTPITNGSRDHAYGFAGAVFSSSCGASTNLSTARKVTFNRLEIHFLGQPKGGSLQVKVDGEASVISTSRAEAGPAMELITLPEDKAHQVALRPMGDGDVVLYGVVMERGTRGIVYDALGSNGAAIHHLTLMNDANWESSLKLRNPDLVILAYGTNESGYANIPGVGYNQDYREIIRRLRAALPTVSILIMAPMDRAERGASGEIGTMPTIPKIVEAQRKLALEMGCAFFNSYAAMGGEGTAVRWYKASPRLMSGDYTHPTRSGADRLAQVLVETLRDSVKPAPMPAVAIHAGAAKGAEGKP